MSQTAPASPLGGALDKRHAGSTLSESAALVPANAGQGPEQSQNNVTHNTARVIVVQAPDIDEDTLEFSVWSRDFIPFWFMNFSFFLVFVAFNAVNNLISMFYKGLGPLALAVVYACFVPANFTSPAWIEVLLGGDSTLSMFLGSLFYTLFVASMIIGTYSTVLPAAALIGVAGGFTWVGQGMFMSRLSGHIARVLVEREILRITTEAQAETAAGDAVALGLGRNRAASRASVTAAPASRVEFVAYSSKSQHEPSRASVVAGSEADNAPITLQEAYSAGVGAARTTPYSAAELSQALGGAVTLASNYAAADPAAAPEHVAVDILPLPLPAPLQDGASGRLPALGTPVVAATAHGLVPAVVVAAGDGHGAARVGPHIPAIGHASLHSSNARRNGDSSVAGSGGVASVDAVEPPVIVLLQLPALPVAASVYATDATPVVAPATPPAVPATAATPVSGQQGLTPSAVPSGADAASSAHATHMPRHVTSDTPLLCAASAASTNESPSPNGESAPERGADEPPNPLPPLTLGHSSSAAAPGAPTAGTLEQSPTVSVTAVSVAAAPAHTPPKAPVTSTKLSSRVLARMLGVSWSSYMMTSVCGSIVALGILNGSTDTIPKSTVVLMFTIFACVALVSNVSFFLTCRHRHLVASPPETGAPKTLQSLVGAALTRVTAVAQRRITVHLVPVFISTGLASAFTATVVSARYARSLVTPAYVPVIVIIFAMTSTIVSTVYARHLTTLKVARRALLYGLAIQLVSLIVVFTQDYRSASLLADAGSVRAWILCIGLAVMQGLTDSLVINGTNAIIPMQYEHSLVPGGFAMSMAFRGLGQCLMFLSAAVITFEFQRIMFIVVLAPALLSLLVLVHSTNETRLSQNLTWSDLLDDISRAPSAVAMAFVSDAKSVQRFVCCHREKSRNNDATT